MKVQTTLAALGVVAIVGSAEVSAQSASAAGAYPTKPVRMVVSFAPGGPNDIVGRAVARALEEPLGQPVIVDNRGGANGTLGTGLAAKAAPDGYTVLIGSLGTFGISPNIYRKLAYQPMKDFEHIAMIAIVGNLLVVHPSVPAKHLKELIAIARKSPGKLNYGAVGGTSHLMAEMMNSMANIETVHVPYKGASPAIVGLISGEVDYFFNAFPGLWPHVQAGKLRALAMTTAKRSRFAPELPTMSEAGLPGYDASTWFSLAAPAGTPREIVLRLNQAAMAGLKSGALPDLLAKMYAEPFGSSPEEARQFVAAEIPKWGRAVKAAGMTPQ